MSSDNVTSSAVEAYEQAIIWADQAAQEMRTSHDANSGRQNAAVCAAIATAYATAATAGATALAWFGQMPARDSDMWLSVAALDPRGQV